ncbi:MSHA pilin protein MshD [Alteromonadaceae bacterium Bs31]|nr:MSHA pilin protein MshD [Alteromonadaceae bacterium Bs31]
MHKITKAHKGVTLIEAIVFLVVIGVALTALLSVFNEKVVKSVDPVVKARALEIAQAQLDEILSRKFDQNSPTGGVPACGISAGVACLGIVADSAFDDVGDYNGYTDNSDPQYLIAVSVINAGGEMGLPAAQARRVTVTVSMSGGDQLRLSAFRANF